MANLGIFKKMLAFSPLIEILVRRVYWLNFSIFSKFKFSHTNNSNLSSFEKITTQLVDFGLKTGDILVLHSSYECLQKTGNSPKTIIEKLILLLGEEGTLVMNAGRNFPEEKKNKDYLKYEYIDEIVLYDIKKSRVGTGVLPFTMVKDKRSVISKFPINPIVAIGRNALEMTEHNLLSEFACGINSSWKFCVDNNAIIVGIGTDLTHSLTMLHVAEDLLAFDWPIKNWYRERRFRVVDSDDNFDKIINIYERRPKWGTLHFAERTLCKDLSNVGILKSVIIDGVLVEAIRAKELIDFLNKKNHSGYPYFYTNF
jgi:aminoglycoside 3-N-acetyltransferase